MRHNLSSPFNESDLNIPLSTNHTAKREFVCRPLVQQSPDPKANFKTYYPKFENQGWLLGVDRRRKRSRLLRVIEPPSDESLSSSIDEDREMSPS